MTTERLTELHDMILTEIDRLGEYLDAHLPVRSTLMKIHPVTRHNERMQVINSLDVDTTDDASPKAILDALKHFQVSDIATLSTESTKITQKYPGIIIVPGDPKLLNRHIEAINTAKITFASALRKVAADKSRRFEKVHQQFPGLIVQQATRKIYFVEGQLNKVTFSWRMHLNQDVKDHSQLMSLLEKRLAVAKMSPATNGPEKLVEIENAIDALENRVLKQGESFRLRRENAFPVPIAHLFVKRPEEQQRAGGKYLDVNYFVKPASLPFFATGNDPDVTVLKTWYPREPGKERKQALEYSDLLPGVETGIYIVRDA